MHIFTRQREGDREGCATVWGELGTQAAAALRGRGRREAQRVNELAQEFQKRRRRHTNIPNSLPWLDNSAAKGKVLFSSGSRGQRKPAGLARAVPLRLGTEAESPGKGSRHGCRHLCGAQRVAGEGEEWRRVAFPCRLCGRQCWGLVPGCLGLGHVQHARGFPMPPGQCNWINRVHISC